MIKPFSSPLELPYLQFTAHRDGQKMLVSNFLKEQFRTVPRSGEELGAACASKGIGDDVFWHMEGIRFPDTCIINHHPFIHNFLVLQADPNELTRGTGRKT